MGIGWGQTSADRGERVYGPRAVSPTLYPQYVKPVLDRLLGLLLLLLLGPVIAIAAAVVRFGLGRPVFFMQQRIGLDGQPFQFYKLRTMIPDRRALQAEYHGPERRKVHKSPEDPRVTSLGKVLRRTRVDELPQLWNVVKGDMSLVGPRPELPQIVNSYEPWQHYRHAVKPGITGLWQISSRNGKPMHEYTDLDIEYIERIGFGLDLKILFSTPKAMIGLRRGY